MLPCAGSSDATTFTRASPVVQIGAVRNRCNAAGASIGPNRIVLLLNSQSNGAGTCRPTIIGPRGRGDVTAVPLIMAVVHAVTMLAM
jgi:hypothetical protein